MQNSLNGENLLDFFGLKTIVMPGRAPTLENLNIYNAVYDTWQSVWKQTFLEVDGSDELYSDHFTRQDYIVAIMHGSRCAALTCFRRAHLFNQAHQNDSWFKPWPQEMLSDLGEKYLNGTVVSWVTIHPDYRKSGSDPYLRELDISLRLGEMLNLFLEDSAPEVAFGATRNNRSVNKFCARAGSVTLTKNVKVHGIDTDLIIWYPHTIKSAQAEFSVMAFDLWANRSVYYDQPMMVTSPEAKVKSAEVSL